MKTYKVYLNGAIAEVSAASFSTVDGKVGAAVLFFDAAGVQVAQFAEDVVLGVVEQQSTANTIKSFFSSLFSRPFNLDKIHSGMSKDQKDAVWHEIDEKIHQDSSLI